MICVLIQMCDGYDVGTIGWWRRGRRPSSGYSTTERPARTPTELSAKADFEFSNGSGTHWDTPVPPTPNGRAQRVSPTTMREAAAATRATTPGSTACGQRSCGKWNSGLLPTSVT